jgi:hypothetical protein
MMALIALPSFARINVRPTSDNGVGDDSDSWTLLGRSVVIPLSANGKSVKATRQIICPGQDRQNGSCLSGNYVFLFQIQSTSNNVNVNIGKLQGFVKVDGDHSGTYGVMICSDSNDQELCTTDPNDPNFTNLSGITFTTKGKKIASVTFTVPSFFNFPAGSTPEEGRGLTFYIQVHLDPALPLIYPSLGIN